MKEKTRTVLFWFILIQPFLDLYWFYNGKLAEVLPFTLPTIIRILAVFVIFCMFFSQKQNWQKLGHSHSRIYVRKSMKNFRVQATSSHVKNQFNQISGIKLTTASKSLIRHRKIVNVVSDFIDNTIHQL